MRKYKKQKGLVNSPVAMGLALFAGYGVFALAAAMNYAETGSPLINQHQQVKHHYPNLADVIEQAEREAEEYHKEQARKKKIKPVKPKNPQEVADTMLFLYGDAEESKEAMLRLRSM